MANPNIAPPPCKLTPELQERFVFVVANAGPIEVACARCEISRQTYHNWIHRADDPNETDPRFAGFRDAVRAAKVTIRSEAHLRMLAAMRNGSLRATQWLIEKGLVDPDDTLTTSSNDSKGAEPEQDPEKIDEPVSEFDNLDEFSIAWRKKQQKIA